MQVPPAAQPPSAEVVLGAQSRFVTAASKDIPLVLRNKAGRVENGEARYQLFIKTQVQAVSREGAVPQCVWTLTSHLQRQLCFTSMTGQLGCTDTVLAEQADTQTGRTQLTAVDNAVDCGLSLPQVADAERQLAQAVAASAAQRFDADLKLNLIPMLTRTGVTVKKAD